MEPALIDLVQKKGIDLGHQGSQPHEIRLYCIDRFRSRLRISFGPFDSPSPRMTYSLSSIPVSLAILPASTCSEAVVPFLTFFKMTSSPLSSPT